MIAALVLLHLHEAKDTGVIITSWKMSAMDLRSKLTYPGMITDANEASA